MCKGFEFKHRDGQDCRISKANKEKDYRLQHSLVDARVSTYYSHPDLLSSLKIGCIMNLQEPGEHSLCGDGIDDKIGFSYDSDVFNNAGIAYYNFYW